MARMPTAIPPQFAKYTASVDYRPIGHIGGGGQGQVYEVEIVGGDIPPSPNGRYAMKVMSCVQEVQVWKSLFEGDILKQLDHPHIVKFVDNFVRLSPYNTYEVCLVMELCAHGDLFDELDRRCCAQETFKEEELCDWLCQIASALTFLHSHTFTDPRPSADGREKTPGKIIFRDLKPENLFFTPREDGTRLIKLGDFGICKMSWEDGGAAVNRTKTNSGSLGYTAPEAWGNANISEKADLFSLGATMFYLSTFLLDPKLTLMAQSATYNPEVDVKPIITQRGYSEEFASAVASLLAHDPERRPSAADLLALPLLAPFVAKEPAVEDIQKVVEFKAADDIVQSVRNHFRRKPTLLDSIRMESRGGATFDSPSTGKCFKAVVRHSETTTTPKFELAFDIRAKGPIGSGYRLIVPCAEITSISVPTGGPFPTLMVLEASVEPRLAACTGRGEVEEKWEALESDMAHHDMVAHTPTKRNLRSTGKGVMAAPMTPLTPRAALSRVTAPSAGGGYRLLVTFKGRSALPAFLSELANACSEPTTVFMGAQEKIVTLLDPLAHLWRAPSKTSRRQLDWGGGDDVDQLAAGMRGLSMR